MKIPLSGPTPKSYQADGLVLLGTMGMILHIRSGQPPIMIGKGGEK